MADQMTAALTGAYGHPVVKTPALDQLCREGVRFDAAYSNCPVCAPARAAMLSGLYVSRTGNYDNGAPLACDVPTFAHSLCSAGYDTIVSGKMHLIGADQTHGFQKRLTPDIYPSNFQWTPDWQRDEAQGVRNDKGCFADADQIGVREWTEQLDYDTETQFRALEFLRSRSADKANKNDNPFCLMVSYTHPHTPYQITREFWDLYKGSQIDTPQWTAEMQACESQMDRWLREYQGIGEDVLNDKERMTTLRRAYYGMVSYVDTLVAELLATLESCGLRENTAILFTSDHGDMLGERKMVEKRSFYEWSSRVPLIASYPKKWSQGAAWDEPVSLIDIFPTLAEFVQAPNPIGIDGTSFMDLLEGREDSDDDRAAISEYHCEGVAAPCFMIRKRKFKYIYIHGHPDQLFDLEADPNETNNLAESFEHYETREALRRKLLSEFDPDEIAADVRRSQTSRHLIHKAMEAGKPIRWDYQPFFDAKKSYTR